MPRARNSRGPGIRTRPASSSATASGSHWERYGDGSPTILLLPTWSIIHSRHWKGQIPYLARHFQVVTFDGRGNGRSDRPQTSAAFDGSEFVADAVAVLDATGTDRAVIAGLSMGGGYALRLAAEHPDRVLGAVYIGATVDVGGVEWDPTRVDHPFEDVVDSDDPWAQYNAHVWRRDWRGFTEWFFGMVFSEPHSTKQIEDCVGWAHDTDPETIVIAERSAYMASPEAFGPRPPDEPSALPFARRVQCPGLVIHGDARPDHPDECRPTPGRGDRRGLRRPPRRRPCATRARPGDGQPAHPRLRALSRRARPMTVLSSARPATWTRALARRRRALYISSPIGLGHAQRDVAIADELRKLHPDLEIDWLAQHPVTTSSRHTANGSTRPAPGWRANRPTSRRSRAATSSMPSRRSGGWTRSSWRTSWSSTTSIEQGEYDLVIGDEAWDVDYYLHENPELKRTAFAWMTDFVGWLPMPEGGEREAFLTADYNAEMIEQIARFPRLRDRAIFVGDPDDIVPDDFGPGLPRIRDWTERNFAFSGYVTGFDPSPLVAGREALRRELGYHDDERVVIVTVGGSGVGEALLRRVIASYPEASRRVPGLRMIAVAGPRIEPASLGAPAGVEVRAFVPDLYRHLVAADLAVVQGGLTTTMELVAGRRPFLYFPLANHFEQNRHVAHRLDRYGAGRRMDYATSDPDSIAEAMAIEIDRPIEYRPVAADGAARAAALIAPLL